MPSPNDRKRASTSICSPQDVSCKRQRPSEEQPRSSWMGQLLTRVWSTCNANAVATPFPYRCDAASRWAAMGREALRLIFNNQQSSPCLKRVVLARRELAGGETAAASSISSVVSGAALAIVCACPAIPSAARAALIFATAANSVYKSIQDNVAWHHFIILEFSEASYGLHLTPDGLYVTGVAASSRSQAQVTEHRKELLTKQVSDRSLHLAEEVKVYSLDAGFPAATQALQTWLNAVVDDRYDLCMWNCQHFTTELLAVVAPFCEQC